MKRFTASGLITLTSDFGTADGYVGAMKGVILSRFPEARLVDLSHEIPPQDIRSGARALAGACPFFPEGTVHLVVVDPGVGTQRAAVVALGEGSLFVAPDNGVLSEALPEGAPAWRLARSDLQREKVSRTFHGRDIFAPLAAALASGAVAPDEVGPAHDLLRLPRAALHKHPDKVRGEIVARDRFGNLVTNIRLEDLPPAAQLDRLRVSAGEFVIASLSWTYADVAVGEWLALIGSGDTLELSVRDGDAAARSGLRVGDTVTVGMERR